MIRTARAAPARRSGRSGDRATRRRQANNRKSWSAPSQPFAGVGVTYREGEEAEAQRQHQNVHHGDTPRYETISGATCLWIPADRLLRANATRVCARPGLSPCRSATTGIGLRDEGFGEVIGI